MANYQFKEGQQLKCITFVDESYIIAGDLKDHKAESITVIMENGQMASVPWALIKLKSGRTLKINLASVWGVEY